MSSSCTPVPNNQLLAALPPEFRAGLVSRLESVETLPLPLPMPLPLHGGARAGGATRVQALRRVS